jgi:DNA-binding MarR family transcriptional regulator
MAARGVSTAPAAGTRWLSAAEQQVWRTYLDVYRLIDERLDHQLGEDAGLSLAEYEVLVQLTDQPERALRMSDLAQRAVNSRSRLTHTVRRMEEAGLVRRRPCPSDGRGVICELTPAGLARIEAAAPGHVELVRRLFLDPISATDIAGLGAALAKIHASLRGT